ncbi:MAG: alginate lyase family protein, partial [Kiritimatiellae bacterium]|nr:alginate lyase family protein [Kiritimatiellia bacterium]
MPATFQSVFVTNEKIDSLRTDIEAEKEPALSAWADVLSTAEAGLDRTPVVPSTWWVPWYYVQPEEHNRLKNGLRDDANTAYAQALAYRITGESRFAGSAIRLLNEWTGGIETMSKEEDSTLSFCNLFPAFIFAADLLREGDEWAEKDQERFKRFLRERALPMNCMEKENNWGNWGMLLVAACGAYLGDADLLNSCAARWTYMIDTQIAEDGHLPREVDRNEGRHGVWYSHFALLPQTLVAEILRVNGTDLFDYVSPEGRSLRLACERLIPWI